MYGRIFKFHIAPWVSKAQPCKRFFSAKTELNAILQREIDEEEGNLAEMDEHYEDDVYELNRRFSKVKLEDYDPIIILEKTDDEGKHMRVRCNIEDQVDDVHYLDVSISNNENKTIGFRLTIIENSVDVENFFINNTDKLLDTKNINNLYDGPKFKEIEDDLQDGMLLYLEENGIDSNFAEVIQNVISVKEQEEYIHFLEEIKKFV